ncbi:MAG TPA: hypothetical protein VEZ41_05690, partial [Allosphingosinicella sp.]|nr:hypothetical protein [Allosphingosinicella sp.]
RGAFTNSSEFNTCIINTRQCSGSSSGSGSGSSSGGSFNSDDIEPPLNPETGSSGRLTRFVTFNELISEAALTEPLIEEPVTSGGDSSSWIEDDVDEEDEEEEEGEQPAVIVPTGGRR